MGLKGDVLVVGLGHTGLSVARALNQRGIAFAVADSRPAPPNLAAVQPLNPQAVHLGPFDPAILSRAATLILSPGVARHELAVHRAEQQGVEVIGDIELFARWVQAPVVAITGSNGKSTVTTLLGEMARTAGVRVAVGGNLAPPALDLLDETIDLYVLELSSFQLETTLSLNAQAACVLNISPDHLDRYPSLSAYIAAKQRVFQGSGGQVLNRDDPAVAQMAQTGRPQYGFTLGRPTADTVGMVPHAGEPWLAWSEHPWLNTRDLLLKGRHNWANILAALALGQAIGLEREAMRHAVMAFRGLPHRCEWLAKSNGVDWYNDSKGTNVGATVAAVQGLAGKVILIAGGEGKGQDFSPLQVLRDKLRAVVLIGRDGGLIGMTLGAEVRQCQAQDMRAAVAYAAALAESGDSVVLSPACASFDWFSDYQARGRAFTHAVREHLQC